MIRPKYHVMTNLAGGWSVRTGGVLRARKRFKTETEANVFAAALASEKKGDVYFHHRDGTVREKVSF